MMHSEDYTVILSIKNIDIGSDFLKLFENEL